MRFITLTLAAVATISTPLDAQPKWPKGTARVVGTIVDSVSGKPILRTRVCRLVELGVPYGQGQVCASPDTTGRYVLDSLPDGAQALSISCDGITPFTGRRLRVDTLLVGAGEEARLDVHTPALTCDMRPFVIKRAVYRGHYRAGFEESRFETCDGSIGAWVTFTQAANSGGPKWPKPNDKYYPTFYVEWEGVLRGPWQYGHMGVSTYELTVERVIKVSRPKKADCGAEKKNSN